MKFLCILNIFDRFPRNANINSSKTGIYFAFQFTFKGIRASRNAEWIINLQMYKLKVVYIIEGNLEYLFSEYVDYYSKKLREKLKVTCCVWKAVYEYFCHSKSAKF